ncbi:MAG: GNAT family N-acetyltransferase [Peptostreptococcaceae bacterium]|nr:GNAT family N-acetyltransferase [Peptostreptococcaceae bacterium]
MNVVEMNLDDIENVLTLYIDYYNNYEECCWTEKTARKRIQQVLTTMDSFSLIMRNEQDNIIGFAMGYFKQYDDIVGYTLEEIVISADYQRKGYGSILLKMIETKVREKGAYCIELQAVNDELHEKYYSKAGYKNADNFVVKVKWFE